MLKQQGVWYVPGKERRSEETGGKAQKRWEWGMRERWGGANESEPLACDEFALDPRMTPKVPMLL